MMMISFQFVRRIKTEMFRLQFIFVVFVIGTVDCNIQNRPTVNLSLGQVVGFFQNSFNGRVFASFEGVPFGKPPVGDLRFRDPLPVNSWVQPVKAFKPRHCIQYHGLENVVKGNEDCLYLNIYVPNAKPERCTQYNVLVHIHGGTFMFGSGDSYAQPHYLMDRDIILVTINYRLGVFGFLSTKDEISPGNYGMKDQVLALKWINQHIMNFGGNPKSITIDGLSAGAASVQYHYLSPMSRGLFHRGISYSGTVLNNWAQQKHPLKKARQFGNLTKCPESNSKKLLRCLRKYPASDLALKQSNFLRIGTLPINCFGPVVDGSFLPDHPYKLLKQKKVYNVPWLASTVRNEAFVLGLSLRKFLSTVNEDLDLSFSLIFNYNDTLGANQTAVVANKIKEQYFNGQQTLSFSDLTDLYRAMTDRLYHVDIESAVRLHAAAVRAPVYFFYYNRLGRGSYSQIMTKDYSSFDVTIADNILLIYTSKILNSDIFLTKIDIQMKDALLDFIVKFMKIGKASFNGVNIDSVDRNENSNFVYLNITKRNNVAMNKVNRFAPYDFWNDLGFQENANLFKSK